ncbi:MAG: aminotransferase class V-fold PLP-dependent enzyme, partial [Bacteroidales bacterium]|nr:aminotransferase class V-fold PLP-dependent enzyme [Bacteroidales bacterium]
MPLKNIRDQFPALDQKVYGKPLVYLDNAATAQRPDSVVELQKKLSQGANANIHRAVHKLASDATEAYENTREYIRNYVNAQYASEIIFTSGATASINLVAHSFGEAFVSAGDEIIVSVAEHHSNIVPWQLLCQRKGAVLKVLDIEKNGVLSPDSLEKLISERTK